MMKRNQQNTLSQQRHCGMCVHNLKAIDYKDPQALRRYTSSYAKIVPRRRSGVCALHQRMLAEAIKRARFMAILPYTAK
jgi:small subunit ribosomal protein S18